MVVSVDWRPGAGAATVLSIVPRLIAYLLSQKFIVWGGGTDRVQGLTPSAA